MELNKLIDIMIGSALKMDRTLGLESMLDSNQRVEFVSNSVPRFCREFDGITVDESGVITDFNVTVSELTDMVCKGFTEKIGRLN